MNHPFKVSDKVVCVDDMPNIYDWRYAQLPKNDQVYVIREVRLDYYTNRAACLLVGITNSTHPVSGRERGFYAFRFRKLTDIQQENKLKHELSIK